MTTATPTREKTAPTLQERLRALPSVTEADRHLSGLGLPHGKPVRTVVQGIIEGYRAAARTSQEAGKHTDRETPPPAAIPDKNAVLRAIEKAVSKPPPNQLRRIINATGVVVHTNLGRAVLPPSVTDAVADLHQAYVNLEFDLTTGKRGERGGRIPELLATLAGSEAGLSVNNNAAAVLLMLSALAAGREVIVSRGELVEIGGSFRVPDIMRQSGVTLVEVGSTNRTRLADYADAITENTAALLKVHRSNFTISGFTEETTVPELAVLARERGIEVWNDLGSGNFYRFQQRALRHIPTVAQEIAMGADLVTFSGDKLLGSVQAGIVVGRKATVQRMRKHPLYRSLRMDRVRSTLLEQSLLAYLDMGTLREHNAVIDLLERTPAEMQPLAESLLESLDKEAGPAKDGTLRWSVVRDESLAGGGAVPEVRIDTLCLALETSDPTKLAASLRAHEPPIIARLAEGRVLLDFRTLFPRDLPVITEFIATLSKGE